MAESGKGIHARSLISVHTYTFSWSIENFPEWPNGSVLRSPNFNVTPNRVYYATFQIRSDGINCLLQFHSADGKEIPTKYNLSLMDTAGQVFLNSSSTRHFFDIPKSKIVEFNDAAKDNILVFQVFMEIRTFETKKELYDRNPVSELDNISALINDLKAMHTSSLYTDVSLKMDDNSLVRANKTILCARSSVFARMFETPMGEAEKNVVEITDLKLGVLRDLLEFLYTGSLRRDDFESVYDLYYAADKYDVPSLRVTCTDTLVSNLKVENACRVLKLADRHSDDKLKDKVMKFIDFYFDKVLKTGAWDKFFEDETKLAASVMKYCSDKFKVVRE